MVTSTRARGRYLLGKNHMTIDVWRLRSVFQRTRRFLLLGRISSGAAALPGPGLEAVLLPQLLPAEERGSGSADHLGGLARGEAFAPRRVPPVQDVPSERRFSAAFGRLRARRNGRGADRVQVMMALCLLP